MINQKSESEININIQQLREFIRFGVSLEEYQMETGTFDARMKSAGNGLAAYLEQTLPGRHDYEQLRDGIYCYIGRMEDVFFEMGILSGARLMHTLLSDADPLSPLRAETEGS